MEYIDMSNDLKISKNVAVIGSSAKLLNSNLGEIIDGFTDVIRFNRAPVEGYSKDIGNKTTIRITNQHVFDNIPFKDWKDNNGQPTYFIKEQKNCKIVFLGDTNSNGWRNRHNNIDKSCTPYCIKRNKINGILPSVGYFTLLYLIEQDIKPVIFGFDLGDEPVTHYWENRGKPSGIHNFNFERKKIKKLHEEGKIIIY